MSQAGVAAISVRRVFNTEPMTLNDRTCDDNYARGTIAGLSDSGSFRGHAATWNTWYTFNEHVKARAQAELFCPGDYYTDDRNDPAVFTKFELTFTFQ